MQMFHFGGKRRLSTGLATFPCLPATLLRYNSRRKSALYDRRKRHEKGDDPNWDGIEISEDGLVHPGIPKGPTCISFISLPRSALISFSSVQGSNADAKHIHHARDHPN